MLLLDFQSIEEVEQFVSIIAFPPKEKGLFPLISSPILYTRRRRTKKMGMETALRMIFLVVFLGWLMVWVLLPTKTYKQAWTPKLNTKLNSTYFGEQGCLYFFNLPFLLLFNTQNYAEHNITHHCTGTNLLLFTFPMMFMASLSCVYLHFQKKSKNFNSKRLQ